MTGRDNRAIRSSAVASGSSISSRSPNVCSAARYTWSRNQRMMP